MKLQSIWFTVASLFCSVVFADDNLVTSPSRDNSEQCDCYLTSGAEAGYFQYHRFWDFRNLDNDGANDHTQAPALLTTGFTGDEPLTSAYFNTSSFNTDWSIQSGKQNRNSVLTAVDTPQNIYISRNSTVGAESSTYLTFRTQRVDNNTVATSELESNQKNLLHCSIRGRFRVIPNPLSQTSAPRAGDRALVNENERTGSNSTHPVNGGAVWGFFTYLSDTQESDTEILTSDPITSIRYSNQPDYDAKTDSTVPGASTQIDMPAGTDWTQWQDHRIDWFNGVSRWYVNDQLVLEKKLNVPTMPSGFIMNLWSDGGDWSGNLSIGAQVTVGVQWIDMVFNTSGKVPHKRETPGKRKLTSCGTACNVDSVARVGFPEVAFQNAPSRASTLRPDISTLLAGLVTVLLVLL